MVDVDSAAPIASAASSSASSSSPRAVSDEWRRFSRLRRRIDVGRTCSESEEDSVEGDVDEGVDGRVDVVD